MDLTIKTSSNQNIQLVSGAPSGVTYNLPGSNSWSAQTGHGSIYIEEIQTGPYTIRYSFFHFIKKITLYFRTFQPLAGVRIAASKCKWNIALPGEDSVTVKQNQFILLSPGIKGEKIVFEKGQEYHGIEILCNPSKLKELMDLFPGIAEFVGDGEENSTIFLQNRPVLAPHTALDIINSRPDFRSEQMLHELFRYLMGKIVEQMDEELPTHEEIKAVNKAVRLILKDIKVHHLIPTIARKVNLNEYRLKYVFRQIFKTSIFQFLLTVRMEKAKELLQNTSKSMDEIAKLCGYRHLTSFITAFHKFYNYTPRTVRKTAL